MLTSLSLKQLIYKILPCCYKSYTEGIWNVKKYADGTAECWGQVTKSTTFSLWANGVYYGTTYTGRQAYPSGLFIAEPSLMVTMKNCGCDSWLGRDSATSGDASYTSSFYPLRVGVLSGSISYTVAFEAKGRWK